MIKDFVSVGNYNLLRHSVLNKNAQKSEVELVGATNSKHRKKLLRKITY
jgi:hypothetical protein